MGSININSIRTKIKDSKKITEKFDQEVKAKFESSKEIFIKEFENHPVTKEIESGADGSNSSGTLDGKGNLFSFIGFDAGSNPVEALKNYIKESFKIKNKGISINDSKIKIDYEIKYPSLEELSSITPMPWEGGNSWVLGIERGISGFSNYMYKTFNRSRSGKGLQSKKEVRTSSYRPVKYLSTIISKFLISVNKIK
jgi:hypothetical protein